MLSVNKTKKYIAGDIKGIKMFIKLVNNNTIISKVKIFNKLI
jgi:hypothetical protein